jgi:hypothetical protein
MEEIEIVDRYSATGTPYLDPDTMCTGDCEGMGLYPTEKSKLNEEAVKAVGGRLMIIGQKEKDNTPIKEDDYVFIKCPNCCGSRLKEPADILEYGGHKWKRI